MYRSSSNRLVSAVGSLMVTIAVVAAFGLWAWPNYLVYQQGLAGEAELKRAEQNRKIAVNEAEAKRDAAAMLAMAEVERAKGVAEANKIIGDSLSDNEAYLRYLWIEALHGNSNSVIYIPTEANLPILEAGKRPRPSVPVFPPDNPSRGEIGSDR